MKKKVLFAIESLAGGGAEKILVNIVKNLNKEKYDITVLSVVRTGVYVKEIENCCRLISFLPDYSSLKGFLEKLDYKRKYKEIYSKPIDFVYKKYIREEFDVEIAFVEGFVTKLVAASPNKNSKKYAWVHTDMITNPHADQNYTNLNEHRLAYRQFDTIFAVSQNVRESFKQKFGQNYNVEIQYNPVDSNEILNKAALIVPNRNKRLTFITVGRLVEAKGYDRLVKIVERLKNKYEFCVWIVGEGTLRGCLEQYIHEHHLTEFVQLLGFQANPYPYINVADAFICSSRTEGFSTVATEALILNKPIITTDCAGMKELFGDHECGIITANNEVDLETGIRKVLDNPKIIDDFKENQKSRAKEFSIETRIAEIEDILNA